MPTGNLSLGGVTNLIGWHLGTACAPLSAGKSKYNCIKLLCHKNAEFQMLCTQAFKPTILEWQTAKWYKNILKQIKR